MNRDKARESRRNRALEGAKRLAKRYGLEEQRLTRIFSKIIEPGPNGTDLFLGFYGFRDGSPLGEAIEHLDGDLTARRLMQWQIALQMAPKAPDTFIQSGRNNELLAEYQDQIRRILTTTRAARESIEAQVRRGHGGRGHRHDRALRMVTAHLLDLYYDLSKRTPATTLRGPTARFLAMCLPELGWTMGDEAIRSLIRSVLPEWKDSRHLQK